MNRLAFLGRLSLDTIVTSDGHVHDQILGGGLIYAAAGSMIWEESVTLVGRYNPNQLAPILDGLGAGGYDTSWLRPVPHVSHQAFFAYESLETRLNDHPARHYLRAGYPLPKRFLDLERDPIQIAPSLALDPTLDDLPSPGVSPLAAHFATTGWRSTALLSAELARRGTRTLTFDPASSDMTTFDKDQLSLTLGEMAAFLPSETQAHKYFRTERYGPREMAEAFAAMGPTIVVIKRGKRGAHLFDAGSGAHWHVPAYPARVADITGAGHAFCGGFLSGLIAHSDPLQAVVCGAVSASLVIEGTGHAYATHAHPQLKLARQQALHERTRRI